MNTTNEDGNIEDELKIPPQATLVPPQNSIWELRTGGGSANNNAISISSQTSIRRDGTVRCLIIGRQAKVADLRIQHSSISRKHAAMYFLRGECILHDFGSKKGTTVNGKRISSSVTLQKDDVIVFGNVRETPFRVAVTATDATTNVSSSNSNGDIGNDQQQQSTETISQKLEDEKEDEDKGDDATAADPGAGLTGRAKREAEIAAMMESLEQRPTYQKYVPSATSEAESTTSSTFERRNNNNKKTHSAKTTKQQQTQKLGYGDGNDDYELLDRITQIATQYKLPITERMTLARNDDIDESNRKRHCMVTCLGMDPSGSRFIVGTTDNTIRLFDFGGMDRIRRDPFKIIQADEGHVVNDVCYSNTGDRILVGTGSVQPYVLDRDGGEIIKFVRGDMYVVDQSKTSGHTAAVTGVDWHPLERDIVLTSSMDGSARLWNLNGKTQFQMLVCDKVFQPKSLKGQRTNVLCVAFHPGGREFAVGTSCGSLQVWNTKRISSRPDRAVYDVDGENRKQHPVNSVVYSVDGSRIACRSVDDDTCKIWDARRMSRSSSPIATCKDVPTLYEYCNPAFNADGTIVCVGTSRLVKSGEGKRIEIGSVKFFHVPKQSTSMESPLEPILGLDISMSSGVTLVYWHPKLNQVFLGCSDGKIEIIFDPKLSRKGALVPFVKAGRQSDGLTDLLKSRAPTGSAGVRGTIIAPNALPIGQGTKRKRNTDDEDPSKSRQPEAPGSGFKTGGTQSGAAINFTQFVVDSRLGATKTIAGKDPREELLKYKEGKNYISQAYAGNREKILAGKTVEEEEEEQEGKQEGKK